MRELAVAQIDPHVADLVRWFEKHQIAGHQPAPSYRSPGPDLQSRGAWNGLVKYNPVHLLDKTRTVHPPAAGTAHLVGGCPPGSHFSAQTVCNRKSCRGRRCGRARRRSALHLGGHVGPWRNRRRCACATGNQGKQQQAGPPTEPAMTYPMWRPALHDNGYRHSCHKTLVLQRRIGRQFSLSDLHLTGTAQVNRCKCPDGTICSGFLLRAPAFPMLFPAGWGLRCWGNH